MGKVYTSLYSFSDQNGAKTVPDKTAHTYIAYIREYPPLRADAYWVFISKPDQNFVDNFFCTTEIETQENREKEAKHVHVAEQSSSKIIETIID